MDFEEFKEKFVEDVKQGLYERGGEDVNVSLHTVNKLNESYDAMTITPVGSNIGVNLSINRFYEAMDHGVSYEEAVNRATNTVMDALENTPSVDVAKLTDYDTMKDKLVMEVVSAETNADMLQNIPHKNMEDMAVVYRFVLDSDENGRASILVTNGMLETMGVTPEQLHADAMENSPELKPAVIKGMSEVVAEMMGMSKEDMAMMGMPTDPENEQMFVATVPDKVHGAGVLACQDFMDQAAESVGGECLAICWSDLDFEKKIIRVEKNLVYRPEPGSGCVARITTPKTDAGKRTIPMLDEVYDAFLEEYQIQKILGFSTQEIDGYSGFVFSTNGGNAYIPECVNGAIDRITKDYNKQETKKAEEEQREPLLLPHFSAHHLRHTFCTRLCEQESNIKVIQSIMGHADYSTTMDIYAECSMEKQQEVFADLNGRIMIK